MSCLEAQTLKIKDFVKERNISYDTVRRYIVRNENIFRGHVGIRGKIDLDDVAVELLNQKYPLKKPVEIIQDDVAARQQLIKAQETIIDLQEHINHMLPFVWDYEHHQELLESAEKETEKAVKEKEKVEQVADFLHKKVGEQFSEVDELRRENARLRETIEKIYSRSFFERLSNKAIEVPEKNNKYEKMNRIMREEKLEKEIEQILKP